MDYENSLDIRGAGGGGGCFPGYVKVSTPSGPVPIQDIKVGDIVTAFDDQGKLRSSEVLAVHIHDNHTISRYRLWGGLTLDVTDNHWVLNQYNAFATIGSLGPDDCLIDARDHLRPILSKEPLGSGTVYNLTVAKYHTFIAEGIRVHNAGLGADIYGAGGGGDGKGGGGSSRTPVEAANSLFSVAFAKILYLLSEGEVQGFPTSAERDILLDGTPIQRTDGGFNFNNVTLAYTPGTETQAPLNGFAQAENTVSVSTTVVRDLGPVTRTITDADVDRCRVIIQHPSLQSVNVSNGDTNPTTVQYRISVSSNGGPFIAQGGDGNGVITVSGKSSGQFQRAYEFNLPAGGAPWQIRVERITADSTSSFLSNQIVWQAYVEITDEKLSYPNSALLGVRVDARQFSNIPDVKVRLRGRKVAVPVNYDPVTRNYLGTWNGTFKQAWTDNPAWIFRDLVVNPVFGVRRYLPTADCDKWFLYSVSQYCDQLVSDGKGGLEPRFRCNVFLQNEGAVFDVLNALASVFRGLVHYSEGKLVVTQDKPGTPVQQFTEANVIQEVDEAGNVTSPPFVYQGSSRTARKSVVIASWDDPDQYYNQVVEYLQDDELLKRFGYLPTDLRLLGVTSRGQALRAAKFVLFSNRYLTNKVSFRVAAEGLAAGIGDVIQISDPLRQGQRLGGRIKAIGSKRVTLDAKLDLAPGLNYTLTLVSPTGTTQTYQDTTTVPTTITNVINPTLNTYTVVGFETDVALAELSLEGSADLIGTEGLDTLGVNVPQEGGSTIVVLNQDPVADSGTIWILEWQDRQAALYRILSISEVQPMQFQIDAIQYNDSAYGYIDNNLPVVVPKDRFTIKTVNAPTDLVAGLVYQNGVVQIAASWYSPARDNVNDLFVSEYRYQWRKAGTEVWSLPGVDTIQTEGQIALPQFRVGEVFEFRVAARNSLGQQSAWTTVDVSPLAPPPNVTGFTASLDPYIGYTLVWNAITTQEVQYEIRKGASWASGQFVVSKTSSTHLLGILSNGTHTYWIRAYDIPGNYSATAASFTITVTPPGTPTVTATVTDPTVTLKWNDPSGTYAAVEYDVRYGSSFGSGVSIGTIKSTTLQVPATWSGSRTFWVAAIDSAGSVGTAGSVSVTINTAPAPQVTGTFTNSRLNLNWTAVQGTLATAGYEIRQGATFATGTVVATTQSTNFLISADWTSARTFWIAAYDGNGSRGTPASFVATVAPAPAPTVIVTFNGPDVVLSWAPVTGSLPTNLYEIRRGDTLAVSSPVAKIQGTSYSIRANWSGIQRFWVAAIDLYGNVGEYDEASAIVTPPSAPVLNQQVIDNNVLLRWAASTGTLPIQSYELRRGATWATAEVIGTKQGGFTVLFEAQSGTYTYWLAGIDSAGTYGTPGSISAKVDQPPDYVLRDNYDTPFTGTRVNMLSTSTGQLVGVNTTETWQQHFTSRGWNTPQDQINAGFPYYVMPTTTTASYEETIDYGTAISGTKITSALTSTAIVGPVTITPSLATSLDGVTFTNNPGADSIYGTNFRYVRMRYDFSLTGGNKLLVVTRLNLRLDAKLKNDSGTGTAVATDVGGTTVNFNTSFIDVSSISVTPSGTTAVFAVYDFVDTPNPTSFKVLLFNANGTRVSGGFSWSARGF